MGMVHINGIICRWSIPNLFSIYSDASFQEFAIPLIFEFAYGVGMVLFGLGVTAVGLSIGYAIVMGATIGLGAFIPMLIFHPQDILTKKGLVIIVSPLVMIIYIALCGKVGVLKDK